MNFYTVVLFVFTTVIFYTTYAGATVCKPFSKFKVDCDECQCSEDGTEYSCTVRDCRPFDFLNGNNGGGSRNEEIAIPYVNDEIPPSREETDNEFADDLDYDEVKDNNNEDDEGSKQFQDVSLNEQDASVIDNGIPDDYRLRRFLKPGK